ncbi:hypothetical protein J6590_055253 [Homalodisca vitripennis]|nr:hypothetical protein J6590_055253 [Homalodisca vitripennis]
MFRIEVAGELRGLEKSCEVSVLTSKGVSRSWLNKPGRDRECLVTLRHSLGPSPVLRAQISPRLSTLHRPNCDRVGKCRRGELKREKVPDGVTCCGGKLRGQCANQ